MRFYSVLILVFALPMASRGQSTGTWDSVARLRPGDQVRVSLAGHNAVNGSFQTWTAEQVAVGDVSYKRPEVTKVERYRARGWSRGKKAALGALIGLGAGAAIGAAGSRCSSSPSKGTFVPNSCGFTPGPGRGASIGIGAAVGGLVGAGVGAALPTHNKELIYRAPQRAVSSLR